MSNGRFGEFGGQYVPETLMNELIKLEKAYNHYKDDPDFVAELDDLFKNYANRPSLLYHAKKDGRGPGWRENLFKKRRFKSYGSSQNK